MGFVCEACDGQAVVYGKRYPPGGVAKDAAGNVSSASVNVTVIKSSQVKTTTDIRAINWAGDHKWSSFIHSSARNDIHVALFHVFDPVGSVYIISVRNKQLL